MILVGRYRSPYVRRVAVTMRQLGLDYERRLITAWDDLDGVTGINPVGRVPALILDDGEVIVESSFIIDYLDGLVGPEKVLTPPAGPERTRVQQIVALAVGTLDKMAMVIYEIRERPPETLHPPWLERNKSQVFSGLAALDRLAPAPWLTGDALTQADLSVGVVTLFVRERDPDMMPAGRFPNLEAMMERCEALPVFQETQPEI
jgi:glutathione S-transferase